MPWRELEQQGWIATAECTEIRVDLPEHLRMGYAVASARQKFRIASENPDKFPIVRELIDRHEGDLVLVIGQYIEQLKGIAASLNAPLIMGQTPNLERGKLYGQFRRGEIKLLVVSKVANFAIDLPDANVAIQVSGTFGSRQEKPNVSDASSVPKPTARSRTSTRLSPAIREIRSLLSTVNFFSPSRATATPSATVTSIIREGWVRLCFFSKRKK